MALQCLLTIMVTGSRQQSGNTNNENEQRMVPVGGGSIRESGETSQEDGNGSAILVEML